MLEGLNVRTVQVCVANEDVNVKLAGVCAVVKGLNVEKAGVCELVWEFKPAIQMSRNSFLQIFSS